MYQKLVIVGNLGTDPEMRYTAAGQAVTNFSVATNRRYTSSDGNQVDETTWFRVSVWGKQAETTNQYLKKGNKEGEIDKTHQKREGIHLIDLEKVRIIEDINF